jgi:hypothetical protein
METKSATLFGHIKAQATGTFGFMIRNKGRENVNNLTSCDHNYVTICVGRFRELTDSELRVRSITFASDISEVICSKLCKCTLSQPECAIVGRVQALSFNGCRHVVFYCVPRFDNRRNGRPTQHHSLCPGSGGLVPFKSWLQSSSVSESSV